MERIYLYVPPEEYAEVNASGACWDDHSKRWYVHQDGVSAALSRWLGDGDDAQFGIDSEEAFVATRKHRARIAGRRSKSSAFIATAESISKVATPWSFSLSRTFRPWTARWQRRSSVGGSTGRQPNLRTGTSRITAFFAGRCKRIICCTRSRGMCFFVSRRGSRGRSSLRRWTDGFG